MFMRCDKRAMLDVTRDILPLTDFKRRTTEFVGRIKDTRTPLVLTINGKPEIVVLDVASYQAMQERLGRLTSAGRPESARHEAD